MVYKVLPFIDAIPSPNRNAKINALITDITGGISILKIGGNKLCSGLFASKDIEALIKLGNIFDEIKKAKKPEISVEP